MHEHSNTHDSRSADADLVHVSSRTELLRAAADRELTPAQSTELDRHLASHPEERRVIQFERELRRSVAASASGSAPSALRDRVLAMRSSDESARASLPFRADATPSNHRAPRPTRWLAIAATVAIVTGGALLALRQPHIEPSVGALIHQQLRTSLVSFIESQHEECEVHADMIGRRFKITNLADVPEEFAKVLGGVPYTGHLDDSGLRFLAGGPCAVPGRGKSVRMVLESTAVDQSTAGRGPLVSIHIQQDTGELNLEPGKTYRLVDQLAHQGEAAPEIFVWRRNGFNYFLTSRSQSAMQMARAAFGAKEPSGTI